MEYPTVCVFCDIIASRCPAHFVLEDEDVIAFLDHRPLFPGHVLVAPRLHYETLSDLPSALVLPLFSRAQSIARAVEVGMKAGGTFVAINNRISQSVPHLHVHVVPRRAKDGLKGFFWPRYSYSGEAEMAASAAAIRAALTL
ncbi:MAG: HIT family protein [Polyangiales bacterium]